MSTEIAAGLLIIHLIISIIYAYYILSGLSNLRKEFIFIIFFLPVSGILAGFVVELLNWAEKQGNKPINMLLPTPEEDILWRSLKTIDEKGDVVPLEEALLINDYRTRRDLVLDTLYDDPLKYLDVLMVARHNEDIETSHYATTMISHTQRKFQREVQKLAYETRRSPDDLDLLNRYIDTLVVYIESGLLEEYLLNNQRRKLADALERKLSFEPKDLDTLVTKIRNQFALGDTYPAYETLDQLKNYWPQKEQTWLEALRLCVNNHDRNKLMETIAEIETMDIEWTIKGKSILNYWLEGSTL